MLIRNTPELIENHTIKTYSCGSPNLKDFLIKNNVHPIYKYTHNKSNKTTWIFVECDELSALLTQWSNNKPTLKGGENS